VTGVAVLREFLGPAHRQLGRSASGAHTAAHGRDLAEVTSSLLRFVTVAGRYVGDVITAFDEIPGYDRRRPPGSGWPQAAADALAALSAASATLVPDDLDAPPPHPAACQLAQRLNSAATSLVAGRDLLQAHFASGRKGRVYRSEWAPVIASPAVAEALLADVAELAGQAAAVVAGIPETRGRSDAADMVALRLKTACGWLAYADGLVRAAREREPVPAADRELLHAIPATAPPARRVPADGWLASELCAAIVSTAERARIAAWGAARLDRMSPAISVTSWRRISAAGTAVSSHCQLLLTGLAVRAAEDGDTQISSRLQAAAEGAGYTARAWMRSSRHLDEVTTDVRWRITRAAAEGGDLAQLTGRLAQAALGADTSGRGGADAPGPVGGRLALESGDLPQVLAAVHGAADGIARLAEANHEQVLAAVKTGRILVPTRARAGKERGDFFVPASGGRTMSLLLATSGAWTASDRTAQAAGDIAVDVQASSRVLAAARAATQAKRRTRHVRARPATPQAGSADGAAAPAGRSGGRPAEADESRAPDGPFEARLREIGVISPRFLRRASALDRDGGRLIIEAAGEVLAQHAPLAGRVAVPDYGRPSGRRVSRLPVPSRSPEQELEAGS
jgi:hypothetical protein